jgi:hypothetical protein
MRRGVPSTVVPALITLLFLLPPAPCGCEVAPPGGSSSPKIQEQVPRKISSNPVDSSHPLIVELLEMVFDVPRMPRSMLKLFLKIFLQYSN